LHTEAHERCFIANSCRVPIRLESTIETRQRQVVPAAVAGPGVGIEGA
jgi:hypothetical protein